MYEHYVNTQLAADRQASMRQAADHHRLVRAARAAGRAEHPHARGLVGRCAGVAAWFARHQPAWRVA